MSLALALPAAAAPVKFDFWFGLSGASGARRSDDVQELQRFCRPTIRSFCTSQGNYDATLQNTIAAFRAGKQPAIVQVYDVGTATMMLSGAYYPGRQADG